ncbi:MAG TPA: sulfatase [Armatimonadota bacterium]|nr:sulfatase [Armatimonadota bacterium]
MNILTIVADTFRFDHLGCYGNEWIHTPNLDRLAAEGIVFENCYADGLPTIPMRRVFYTGNSILPEGEWKPLLPEDVTLAQILGQNGYTSGLVADCYHLFKPNLNFHEGFDSWEWIRGQETDRWRSGPKADFDVKQHMPEHLWNEQYDHLIRQYLMNMQDRVLEEDYIVARSCRAAMSWLERNASAEPFMLWLELFDPHEPWDAPKRFRDMYHDDYPVEDFQFGYGCRGDDILESDYPAIRGLYAAEVTFVDLWLGRLFEKLDDLGLTDDTVIVFTTDHGTHLGEQGCVQKTPGLLNSQVAKLPLVVRHPDRSLAGKRVPKLVSGMDIAPTLLDLAGVGDHPPMDGKSFWPLATGEVESLREHVLTGFGGFGAARTDDWHYFQACAALHAGKGPALYDLNADPGETTNVVDDRPDVVAEMKALLATTFPMPEE